MVIHQTPELAAGATPAITLRLANRTAGLDMRSTASTAIPLVTTAITRTRVTLALGRRLSRMHMTTAT
jgi:hypothetical protein